MKFIRLHTRLHADVYEAYRSLTRADRIEKWLGKAHVEVEGEPYQSVVWHVREGNLKHAMLEFYIMKCAVKTEYCTEVNLLIRFTEAFEPTDEHTENSIDSCKQVLERLRKHYNKEWVIQDKDLTAGIFRQSL